MATNWNLLQVPDIGQAFKAGYDQRRQQNALAAYAQNPGDPGNLNALAEFNPGFVVQQKQQQQNYALEQSKIQQKSHAEQMQVLGRLVSGVQDETSYQRALAAARQVGIDVSSAPPSYNPEYVAQTRMILDAYNKDGGQALSTFGKIASDEGLQPGTPQFAARVSQLVQADAVKTIPYTQGGGVAGFNPLTGTTSSIVQPNPGGFTTGAPVQQPPASFNEGQTATNPRTGEKVIFRGGQWVPMQGGPTPRASGNFRP